jgi:uncharacterized integral membrane protein
MRILMSFLVGITIAAAAVGLGVLVAENSQSEHFMFLGTTFQGNKGWMLAGAVVSGFFLAILLLIPGRLAGARHRWTLRRQARAQEDRMRALREQHAELQGSHRSLLEEHQRVMQQVLAPLATGQEPATSVVHDAVVTPPRLQEVASE